MPDAQSDGFHLKIGDKIDISLSQHTANQILSTVERMWYHTLDWITQNTLQFAAIVLLLGWIVLQARLSGVEKSRMKHDYEQARANARKRYQEQPLPLPEPERKKR